MTKLKLIALAVALAPVAAFANDGPGFAVTGGYGTLDGGNPFARVPFQMPGPLATVDHDTDDDVWSVSAAWFIDRHWAIEAWATSAARQGVEIDSAIDIDLTAVSYSTSPVTLMAQYHFDALGRITPFVGAGWHWTNITSAAQTVAPYAGATGKNDNGFAAVAGLDLAISQGWFARGEVRWMDGSTEISSRDMPRTSVNTDRVFYGVSLGYRF